MKLSNITIGADPECFIINSRSNKVVSAIGLIPGEKGNPWRSKDMPKGFGIETDNILAEFNIPPVTCKESFIRSICYMQDYLTKFVKAKNPNLAIRCAASQVVPKTQLRSKQAKEFGCSVDYNVYTGEPNPKPQGDKTDTRSAGMHIHCGYLNNNIDTSLKLIKYFDAYIGIPSVLKDNDTARRSLYGKAGCFRLTSYGFEYRTLSGYMMSNPQLLEFVWNQITKAIDAFRNECSLPSSELVMEAINNSDVNLANNLIKYYNLCADYSE